MITNEQTYKHKQVIKQVLSNMDIETSIYSNNGIFTDTFNNLYKVSIREEAWPNFYLDSSTYNKLKKSKNNAFYIVVVQNEILVFEVKNSNGKSKHKYEKKREFANKNTFKYSNKTIKWVTIFNRYQTIYTFKLNPLKSVIKTLKPKKEETKNFLFQNI